MQNQNIKLRIISPALYLLAFLILSGSLFSFSHAQAASGINKEMSYYGVLNTASGTSVADGNYDMVFKIYTTATGGTPVWTGNYTSGNGNSVAVEDGNFTVLLGSGNNNALDVDFSQDTYYVGVTVGTDSEMTPRQQLAAAPYAFNSDAVNGTSIYKGTGNPNGVQTGNVGDMAMDTANNKLYIKTSGTATNTGWSEVVGSGGVTTLSGLTDTNISSPATNNILVFNGSKWANQAPGNLTTSTSGVTITGGSNLSWVGELPLILIPLLSWLAGPDQPVFPLSVPLLPALGTAILFPTVISLRQAPGIASKTPSLSATSILD